MVLYQAIQRQTLRGEGKKYCKAITLRSGRELKILGQQPAVREPEIKKQDQVIPIDQKCKGSGPGIREKSMIIR